MIFLFLSSFWIFFSILSENRNSIWAPFWCICFTVSLSLSLSLSHFEIMQDYISIFFAWNIKLYCCISHPSLSLSAGPWWHQPENGSFNLQENKLRILIFKKCSLLPLEKKKKKEKKKTCVKTCSLQLSGACRCVCFHLGMVFTWNDTLKAVFYFNQTVKIYTQT